MKVTVSGYTVFCRLYHYCEDMWIPDKGLQESDRDSKTWLKRCEETKKERGLLWRGCIRSPGELAYGRYRIARNDYVKLRREEERVRDNLYMKIFHNFIRVNSNVKETLVRIPADDEGHV